MSNRIRSEKISYFSIIAATVLGLYLSSLHSYLLFHSLIEITTIAIGFTLFILTWNTRRYSENTCLNLLGIGYAFIALIDLLHALAYKGMNIFPGVGANLPTQLWIAARSLQAVTLCVAPLFMGRRVDNRAIFGGYAAAVTVLVALVYSGNFPDCYIDGKGLTFFKIGSEYAITAMLLASLYLFSRDRKHFNDKVFLLTISSIACTALSELSFTAYVSVYGSANMLGHYFKLAAFYLIYQAILVTGLKEPFGLIFRELKQAQEAIGKARDTLEDQVNERTAELRASEEKYRVLIESANDAVFIHEIKEDGMPGPFIEVNELACVRLGYSKEELARLSPMELDDPRYRARIAESMKRILVDGQAVFETAHMTKDGRSIPVEVSTHLTESRGRHLLFSIARDITERKQAEDERLTHLKFLEILDQVNRAIQGTNDLDQMMSDVLNVVLSVFDCDRAWLFYPCDPDAPSFRVPMEITKPEYPGAKVLNVEIPMPPDMVRNLREALESTDPVTYTIGTEKTINKMTAEEFGVKSQIMVALYPKLGKPWVFGLHQCSYPRVWTLEEKRLFQEIDRRLTDALTGLLTYRDLRESEEKYRQIVDTANEGIWVLGPDTMTTFVNARMAEMLGYSCEEMIGRLVTDFMFEEDAPDHHTSMEKRRRGISENYERRYRRKNGQAVWTLASAVPILDAKQNFKGTFAMFTDITEKKLAEGELRRLNDELEQRVMQRTVELAAKNDELERINQLFVGRELRMVELKEKIAALEGRTSLENTTS